eukprot:352604-Chlamydomonas_euryale.AAC.1
MRRYGTGYGTGCGDMGRDAGRDAALGDGIRDGMRRVECTASPALRRAARRSCDTSRFTCTAACCPSQLRRVLPRPCAFAVPLRPRAGCAAGRCQLHGRRPRRELHAAAGAAAARGGRGRVCAVRRLRL